MAGLTQQWRSRLHDGLRSSVEPHLVATERYLTQVSTEVERSRDKCKRNVEALESVRDALNEVRAGLAALRVEWRTAAGPGATGLSPLVTLAIGRLSAHRGNGGQLLAEELGLSSGASSEFRIPVVATMKAGKSTLLSALLGADVAPRRAHGMTAIATRYVLDSSLEMPVLQPTPDMVALCADIAERVLSAVRRHGFGEAMKQRQLQNFLDELQRTGCPSSAAHGLEQVRDRVEFLNHLARIALSILQPKTVAKFLACTPEVRVPSPALGCATGSPRNPPGNVVLVDTPGCNEARLGPIFAETIKAHVANAHGCLVVVDYTQIGGIAEARLAELISTSVRQWVPGDLWVVVNRVDQRRSDRDLDRNSVRAGVCKRLGLRDPELNLIETWGNLALATSRCLGGEDGEAMTELFQLTRPFESPDPNAWSTNERAELIRQCAGRSGLSSLREEVLGSLIGRVPSRAVSSLLRRHGTNGLPRAAKRLADDARWAVTRMEEEWNDPTLEH
jgi:hypothetical protein